MSSRAIQRKSRSLIPTLASSVNRRRHSFRSAMLSNRGHRSRCRASYSEDLNPVTSRDLPLCSGSCDSSLEEAVSSEPVSGSRKFPASKRIYRQFSSIKRSKAAFEAKSSNEFNALGHNSLCFGAGNYFG